MSVLLTGDQRKPFSGSQTARWLLAAGLPLMVVAVGIAALGIGRYSVPPEQVYRILLATVLPIEPTWSETDARVVILSRGPRVMLSMLVGGGLALSGAVLQGVFRNPLVGPQILGVSSGAAFGGALAILFGLGWVFLMGGAMVCGILALVIVYAMSQVDGRAPILMLVLAGVVTSAFFTALVSVLTYVADPYSRLPAIVFWLMGSLATATYPKVVPAALPVLIGGGLILLLRWRLNILSLGEEEAAALGVRVQPLRWLLLVAVAAIVAGAVAVSGVVGWVGLVVPHLARMWIGPDHRVLLPVTLLLGAAYLTIIDTLARSLTPAEIPLGILTALVGAPVFFVLLRRTRGRGWVDA